MLHQKLRHQNNCIRCPILGSEDAAGEEWYQFLALRFDIRIARQLCRASMLHRVDAHDMHSWLEATQVERAHLDHLPLDLGPGVMVTLPSGCGRLIIDGNHRAARAIRDGREFLVYLLPEKETRLLLQRSMGYVAADHYWKRLTEATPHPDDLKPGGKPRG